MTTIRVPAATFADHDDDLAAAAADVAQDLGIEGYDLSPRYEDEDLRDEILLDVPDHVDFSRYEIVDA